MPVIWPWLAAAGLGAFHGLNPGMGWLFAVSNGLQAQRSRAVLAALLPLGAGHCLAMAAVLIPAAALESLALDRSLLQILAAVSLIGFGLYKWFRPRHPRFVARVGPSRLTLWSFLMATAHGAGLMLLPVFFGLSAVPALAGDTPAALPERMLVALAVVGVHTAAMIVTAGAVAWLVYRWLGLRLLRAGWVNTDRVWALALVTVGAIALLM